MSIVHFTLAALTAELTKLQRMQNQALRTIERTRIRERSVLALHSDCNARWNSYQGSIKYNYCVSCGKRAHGGDALEQGRVRTRGDLKLLFEKRGAKTSFYQKSTYYRGTLGLVR